MLKKDNRLKKRYQYNYVYRAGIHYSSKNLIIYVASSKTKNIKVGFSVTKKIGKACVRNLIRRRLREIVYNEIPKLKQNCNLIVVAKESITNATMAELTFELKNLFQKAQMFNEKTV